jgi:hypothetical protein
MPYPTVFASEEDLADYLFRLNPVLLGTIGWDGTLDTMGNIVNDALEAVGSDDIGQVSHRKMRIIGRYFLWKAVLDAVTGNRYNFSADGASYSLSDSVAQVQKKMSEAIVEVAEFGIGIQAVTASRVTRKDVYARKASSNGYGGE